MSLVGQSRRLSDVGMSASPQLRTYHSDVANRRFGPISEVGEPFPPFKSDVSHASMTDPTRYSSSARRQAPGLTPTMPVNTRVRWL